MLGGKGLCKNLSQLRKQSTFFTGQSLAQLTGFLLRPSVKPDTRQIRDLKFTLCRVFPAVP